MTMAMEGNLQSAKHFPIDSTAVSDLGALVSLARWACYGPNFSGGEESQKSLAAWPRVHGGCVIVHRCSYSSRARSGRPKSVRCCFHHLAGGKQCGQWGWVPFHHFPARRRCRPQISRCFRWARTWGRQSRPFPLGTGGRRQEAAMKQAFVLLKMLQAESKGRIHVWGGAAVGSLFCVLLHGGAGR